ncbi:hypothetical protein ACFDV1_005008, partial [Salmonella enterica]
TGLRDILHSVSPCAGVQKRMQLSINLNHSVFFAALAIGGCHRKWPVTTCRRFCRFWSKLLIINSVAL